MRFNVDTFDALTREGWLTASRCGQFTLYNYSAQAVYARQWTPETLRARGLVIHDDGRLIANPFPKFFNLGEREEVTLDLLPQETPELSHKYDGTLIIVFWTEEMGWRAITRGSWDNQFTAYANSWIAARSMAGWNRQQTYLFELVAPWNRIVVPYGKDDLILIGVRDNDTDQDDPYEVVAEWAERIGVTPVGFDRKPLASIALDDPTVKDREGFVARYSNGLRVKLKYHQYVLLHKIVTGLSVKGIWELLSQGKELELADVPDEFHVWYRTKKGEILAAKDHIEQQVSTVWSATGTLLSRKDYAQRWAPLDSTIKAALFKRLDNRPYDEVLWRAIKPHGQEVYRVPDF